MIKVNLMGGLGNQMFQLASALALSQRVNQKICLDLTFLKKTKQTSSFTKRNFELDVFDLSGVSVTSRPNLNVSRIMDSFLEKIKKFHLIDDNNSKDLYPNKPYRNYLLNGYFQSEDYFSDYRSSLLKIFNPKLSSQSQNIVDDIKNKNSLSIHIRRGDYITNTAAAQFHGICSPEYYEKSFFELTKKTSIDKVLIFSDDINWCKDNLKFSAETVYVEHNTGKNGFEDIFIMKNCKHNIIANSSFSWWGAWLNENPNKIVIAPQIWFAGSSQQLNIVPKNWIRI